MMDTKIELMARYLSARGWSMWTETDVKLNALREIEHSAYEEHRHKGNQVAVKASYVAVLQAVFGE
jgi:predicted tellurium resistance membrane protein TerC